MKQLCNMLSLDYEMRLIRNLTMMISIGYLVHNKAGWAVDYNTLWKYQGSL